MDEGPFLPGDFISYSTFSQRKMDKQLDSQHSLKKIINIIY